MKLLIFAIVAFAVGSASLQVQAGEGSSQAFTSVANILKTKHDTAKNSISNIR
ncbi:MAG: hypothetical protein ACO1OG_04370 [Devosia sp.]